MYDQSTITDVLATVADLVIARNEVTKQSHDIEVLSLMGLLRPARKDGEWGFYGGIIVVFRKIEEERRRR